MWLYYSPDRPAPLPAGVPRHQECHGGRPRVVEPIAAIPGISSLPVRRTPRLISGPP
jgi:hypothetical protein